MFDILYFACVALLVLSMARIFRLVDDAQEQARERSDNLSKMIEVAR
jgi:hypothetical protein